MQAKINWVRINIVRIMRSQSFRRYLFVGISTVVIDYILLAIFRVIFSSGIVWAVTIAYWTSIIYNFLLNRHWSFKANRGMVPRQMIFYGLLLLFNYLVTLGIVWGFKCIGVNEYVAKLFALAVTITWTYVAYKRIVFVA